ncbi:Mobile element protein [Streptococcus gallolyticus]|uniref:Mobile element protein n=1 Tax=Streptococcus gallolyticus TaxID=315405 RepID=A0A139MUG7_9STRE|nr:Mobile element protein [Streptococcus gallolyticus]
MVEVIPQCQCLISVPGVGKVYAVGIIAEIGQIERFKDHLKSLNIAGLNWKQNQSGNTTSQNTDLVKRSNRYLRYYLVEVANSIRHQGGLWKISDYRHKSLVKLVKKVIFARCFQYTLFSEKSTKSYSTFS